MHPHHSEENKRRQNELKQLFQEQKKKGGGDDDGDEVSVVVEIGVDVNHRVVVLSYPHPTKAIALDVTAATELRDMLTDRITYLRAVRPGESVG